MPSSNRTGSFYMLLSVICFSVMDILVKLTTTNYPIGEIAFFRGLFGLIPIFFLIPKNKIFTFFKTIFMPNFINGNLYSAQPFGDLIFPAFLIGIPIIFNFNKFFKRNSRITKINLLI